MKNQTFKPGDLVRIPPRYCFVYMGGPFALIIEPDAFTLSCHNTALYVLFEQGNIGYIVNLHCEKITDGIK